MVAEVALELAHDRRHGIRGEREPAVGVVAVDRLDQRERRDLDEIVVLVAIAVAPREPLGQRQEPRHEFVAGVLVARAAVALEQPGVLPGAS